MAPPLPLNIGKVLKDLLAPYIAQGGQFLPRDHPVVLRVLDDCDKLQRVDVVEASYVRTLTYQLCGALDECMYWARNVEANGERWKANYLRASFHSNLGFVTRAAEFYPSLTRVEDGQISVTLDTGLSAACFSEVRAAIEALERAGGTAQDAAAGPISKQGLETLANLGVREQQLRLVMDEAGSVMRERSLLWLNPRPDYQFGASAGAPFIAIWYRLRRSPAVAAAMTWELAERLAERDLIFNGVTAGFLGEGEAKAA